MTYSYIEGMAYVYLDHSGNKHYAGGKMHTVFNNYLIKKQFDLQTGIISTIWQQLWRRFSRRVGIGSVGIGSVNVGSGGVSSINVGSGGVSSVNVGSGGVSSVNVGSEGISSVNVGSGGVSSVGISCTYSK